MKMQQRQRGWRIYWPSYPFAKGLQRTNAQVRHDRGGVTAGFFFRSQAQLNRMMHDLQKNSYQPARQHKDAIGADPPESSYKEEEDVVMDRETAGKNTIRYKLWLALHRLQGYETRFALKVVLTTVLLSIPAWLDQSRDWYTENESWWAVVMAWIMLHPRYESFLSVDEGGTLYANSP
jgi:hypothetical protein